VPADRAPAPNAPLRLAFVGQRVYFHYCALEEPADGVEPAFFDFRFGGRVDELLAALHAFAPHVVFVWRPEIVPAGAFADLDAVTVGYLTEPLPRPGGMRHRDLEQRLEYLREADPANFDRIVSFDPLAAPAADPIVPVWRSFPIPVSDAFFAPVRPASGPPKVLFTGRATEHRDAWLDPVKHHFDVVHLAHGVTDRHLRTFLAEVDIGVNLHNEPYPTFENRVSVYLAAGILVISEPLSPRHGLQPGIDYLEATGPWHLWELVNAAARTPDAFHSVRLSGRRRAERFRASRVFPRFCRDLLKDVATFGSMREAAPLATVPSA
jgi:hypothetical protein